MVTPIESRVSGACELARFRLWLDGYPSRTGLDQHCPPEGLSKIKMDAVEANDQELASAVWCLETVMHAQRCFLSAFDQLKDRRFYGGWCQLEQAENSLKALSRHYTSPFGRFGVPLMWDSIPKLQSLFPYQIFGSPGYIIQKAECSICGQEWRVRGGCGHRRNMLYDGEPCYRIVTECDLMEVSCVVNPVQKYSVMFPQEGPGFNYGRIEYAVRGMVNPWAKWSYAVEARSRPSALASDMRYCQARRNSSCPCGSQMKFKKCCILKLREIYQHHQFEFPDDPSRIDFPTFLPSVMVYGVDDGVGGLGEPPEGSGHSDEPK